jgi:hypothetical protein
MSRHKIEISEQEGGLKSLIFLRKLIYFLLLELRFNIEHFRKLLQ